MSKPMMINDNGVIRPMSLEEIEAMRRLSAELPPLEPTPEERIATLEQRMDDMDTKVIDTVEVLQILNGEVTE